ncbi:hypothetical protein LCGC14_2305500 [marine sediment metagenome]|uniref:Uncharacterized protein n=1 Tax=marine sediment metagenome TaxID=412755 RepID=A0A0F9D9P5_9ZZZZ
MSDKKKYKRLIYCERCNHPEDRHTKDEGADKQYGCTAPTVMAGAPKGKCPRMVYPTGGAMASLTQRLTMERGRAGQLPPPFEADDRPPRR